MVTYVRINSERVTMGKPLTATQLRSNLYRIHDEVANSGVPQEIIRGERKLLIISADRPRFRLTDLPKRKALNCSPDELVRTGWEAAWKADD